MNEQKGPRTSVWVDGFRCLYFSWDLGNRIKKLGQSGLDTIIISVLGRPSKNGVKSVDQRSPPIKPRIILEGFHLSKYLHSTLCT